MPKRQSRARDIPSSVNIPQTPLNPKFNLVVCVSAIPASSVINVTYKQLAAAAEQQLKTRLQVSSFPTTTAAVFNAVHLNDVQAWGSQIGVPAATGVKTGADVTAINITVGGENAMVPKSTMADTTIGVGERAFARCRGNATTWGTSIATEVAAKVQCTYAAASEQSPSPVYLRFNVSLF